MADDSSNDGLYGGYLLDAANSMRKIVGARRSVGKTEFQAICTLACGALKVFLEDVRDGRLGSFGTESFDLGEKRLGELTTGFLIFEKGVLLAADVPHDLVDNLLAEVKHLLRQPSKRQSQETVVSMVNKLCAAVCQAGDSKPLDYSAEKNADLARTIIHGLYGVGIVALNVSLDIKTCGTCQVMTKLSEIVGGGMITKAIEALQKW